MKRFRHPPFVATLLAVSGLGILGCSHGPSQREADQAIIDRTQAQVRRIAAELDKRTTDAGVYIRVQENDIQEKDPWGRKIQVNYSQGGVAEVVDVRSAGFDGHFHTNDDIVARCMAANFKGLGEGIKENAGDVGSKAAKGLVKGAIEGAKESVKDAWSAKKKKDGNTDSKNDNTEKP